MEPEEPQYFNEIQLQDQSNEGQKRILHIPQEPVHAGFQPYRGSIQYPSDFTSGNSSDVRQDLRFTRILSYARIIKWVCVIEILLGFIYVGAPRVWPMIFFLPLGIIGFLAGYKLNWKFTICYLVYLSIAILLRFILIIVVQIVWFAILQVLILLFNLYILVLVARFYRLLKGLSDEEKTHLLMIQNGESPFTGNGQPPQFSGDQQMTPGQV